MPDIEVSSIERDFVANGGVLSDDTARNLVKHAFELWIDPEIEKRKKEGKIPESFHLAMAQRIQRPDGSVTVRINHEVRGNALARSKTAVKSDDDVFTSEIEEIIAFDIPDEELDCSHWTLISVGKQWFISFNFLRLRAKCQNFLSKASQFLEAAQIAQAAGHPVVAVDTLFSACELISKANLVASRNLEIGSKSHKPIKSGINNMRRNGNIEGAFVDLYNKMEQLRPQYRYDSHFSEDMPVTRDDLELVHSMIETTLEQIRPSHERRSNRIGREA